MLRSKYRDGKIVIMQVEKKGKKIKNVIKNRSAIFPPDLSFLY